MIKHDEAESWHDFHHMLKTWRASRHWSPEQSPPLGEVPSHVAWAAKYKCVSYENMHLLSEETLAEALPAKSRYSKCFNVFFQDFSCCFWCYFELSLGLVSLLFCFTLHYVKTFHINPGNLRMPRGTQTRADLNMYARKHTFATNIGSEWPLASSSFREVTAFPIGTPFSWWVSRRWCETQQGLILRAAKSVYQNTSVYNLHGPEFKQQYFFKGRCKWRSGCRVRWCHMIMRKQLSPLAEKHSWN